MRTLLVIISIAAGVFAVGTVFGMNEQLVRGLDQAHQSTFPSHINMFTRNPIDEEMAAQLARIPGIVDVDLTNQMSVRYKRLNDTTWQPGMVATRPDYYHQMYDLITLKSGEWPNKNTLGVERLTSDYFGINPGDEAEIELAKGQALGEVVSRLGIADQTYYRWRKENGQLENLVADQALDMAILKEAAYPNS